MEKENKNKVFEAANLLAEAEIAADKINFCILNLMELVELAAYDDQEENEKPLYFWNNRERIEAFIEMQNDYYHDLFLPKLNKAQELIDLLMEERSNQDKAE